ncbi:serpin family protein [Paenibacillus alkalitolerans]|uniref:serpin family protein n=1 Tax=Paenibacillus alkalitolerans TaxID=2799335 RepID=UPI0018F41BD3|nr:serpin family protein [Paenibacillus alkalitolerans]
MRKWSTMCCICVLLTVITGCGDASAPMFGGLKPEYSAADADTRIVTANNRFGLSLYKELFQSDGDENVLISPLSIATALSMTYNGAAGSTKTAMEEALQLKGLTLDDINAGNRILKFVLEHTDPDVELSIANSLWAKEGMAFHKTFLDNNRTYYDAEVTSLDLTASGAPGKINSWVTEKTKGKIENIVEGPIDPLTVLFLINAIYFKGDWTDPFPENATSDGDFVTGSGASVQVPMMGREGEFEYKETDGYQAVRLPYGKETLRMVVYVPKESSGLDSMMFALLAADPGQLADGFAKTEGHLRMPRFKLEYKSALNDALEALGMGIAFDSEQANFENMANIPPNLYIANVLHKTFIEVNEKGAEAAAVTSVEGRAESAPANFFRMEVNRPFFFTIEDGATGSMLFMGSVTNPAK